MTDDDLAYASIADLGPRLQRRELSPVDLARICLERIEHLDSGINAFITVLGDQALAEARAAEQEIAAGGYRGPLHGIPIAHKDLYYTRGVRTTAGSRILTDFVPTDDAEAVARLKSAGTILLGKLNMHEFAAGGTSDNPHYGPVHNPWRHGYHPGGSSGGSSAALAAGMCYAATGSDTAGSIRIPSHCCGTSGIKPTYGRVSCYGVIPLSWSLDHAGPMTRTIEDSALVLNAIAGYDRRDAASVDRPVEDFGSQLRSGVAGLRIGVPRTYFTDGIAPDVERAWRAAIDVLVDAGARPVEIAFRELDDALTIGPTILRSEMYAYHRDWFSERPADYSPALHDRFAAAATVTLDEFIRAQRARDRIRADLWSAFDAADVLVTPTAPLTATPIESLNPGSTPPAALNALTRFTYPFNVSGFPAASVPGGFDTNGLPIGLQFAAPPWQESMIFQVAHTYQELTTWHQHRPSLTLAAI